MAIVDHLIELRSRLLYFLLFWLCCFLALLPFAQQLYKLLSQPLLALIGSHSTMIATDLISPFFTPLKLCYYVSLYIAMPVLLFHIWRFVAPGLYNSEKRLFFPLLLGAIVLFYLGITFAYWIVFPLIFAFLTSIGPEGVQLLPDINSYLNFTLRLFFAFGIAFEIPIFIIGLSRVFGTQIIAKKRPFLIIMFFIAAMLLTPPDMFSQLLLALPMCVLFEVGLLVSRLLIKKS